MFVRGSTRHEHVSGPSLYSVMKPMTLMEFHDKEGSKYRPGVRIVNGIVFSASGNYLTEISNWGSEDESARSLQSIPLHPTQLGPVSQALPLVLAKYDEDEEEDWDDEDDEEDWDDDDDWDDEDEEAEDWDDEDEDEDWDDDEDWDEDEDDEEDEE